MRWEAPAPTPYCPAPSQTAADQLRMIGKAKIIVAAKREVFAPANRNMGVLRTLQSQTAAEQLLLFPAVQLFA